jgi:ribonuclease P protein component
MVSGCGWLLNGDVKFLAVAAKKGGSGSRSNYRRNTPAHNALSFPRRLRLTRETDLEVVRRAGKRIQTERLEARASASLLPHPRVGIVVPKHRRRIVERNRVKRRLRELVRTSLLPNLDRRIDLLIRAKPEAYNATFQDLAADVGSIGQWASLISG